MTQKNVVIIEIDRVNKKIVPVAELQNAYDIGYELEDNEVGSCSFSLPSDDPKAEFIGPARFAEIYDNGDRVGLFKIAAAAYDDDQERESLTVTGVGAINTLNEYVMFSVHNFTGQPIPQVITGILQTPDESGDPKQSDWILHKCDFDDVVIDYAFENCSELEALLSLPKEWETRVKWSFDTSQYPFRVSLEKASDTVSCRIEKGQNCKSISIVDNYSQICNRFYGLGSGEGINQTNIMLAEDLESENAARNGHYYVEDADSIAKYGLIEDIYVDRSVTQPSLLLMGTNAMLSEWSKVIRYVKAEVIDTYPVTGKSQDHLTVGALCRIVHKRLNPPDDIFRVLRITKNDVTGAPDQMTVELGRLSEDLSDTAERLYRTDRTDKVCAQGATNIWSRGFADNADKTHPITVSMRLPDDLVYVNKCVLDYQIESFRAYEKAAASSDLQTSSETTVTIAASNSVTSQSDGELSTSSFEGGAVATTTSSDDAKLQTTDEQTETFYSEGDKSIPERWTRTKWDVYSDSRQSSIYEPNNLDFYGNSIQPIRVFRTSPWEEFKVQICRHSHPHTHKVTVPAHNHQLKIPNHKHTIHIPAHTHIIPSHTHKVMAHSHTIGAHSHSLDYGIYEKSLTREYITGVRVTVDGGTARNYTGLSGSIDILQLLDKDGQKVTRGSHKITITPLVSNNASNGLCRLTGEIFVQAFIQSRGDYAI